MVELVSRNRLVRFSLHTESGEDHRLHHLELVCGTRTSNLDTAKHNMKSRPVLCGLRDLLLRGRVRFS